MFVIKVEDPETGKYMELFVGGEQRDADTDAALLRQAGFKCSEPKRIVSNKETR